MSHRLNRSQEDLTESLREKKEKRKTQANTRDNCGTNKSCPQQREEKKTQLQKNNAENDKIYGCIMDPLVDFAWAISKDQIVAIHQMLHDHI